MELKMSDDEFLKLPVEKKLEFVNTVRDKITSKMTNQKYIRQVNKSMDKLCLTIVKYHLGK